ncbi:gasdermin-C-like [Saccopteryx bilineata]|uniref:gasdermin-C-like n=1 Tax=Saccopteryx bilineata TaxID=59482 RepID=UPI00338EA4A6
MPSMFERATKELVKETGDKELRPVSYMTNATKINCFTLVQRNKSLSLFWKLPDTPLDVSLLHILEPGTSVPDAVVKGPVLFSDTVFNKQQAGGSMDAGAGVSFSGEATQFHGSSFECQIVTIPYETWTELLKRKLRDPEPSILGQCRKARMKLYVVTEIVELLKDTELKDLSSENILGKLCINLKVLLKGEGQGGGHKVREKKLTVPQGSVVAYRRKQLVIKGKGWDILHIAEDDKEKTFPEENSGIFQNKKKESLKEEDSAATTASSFSPSSSLFVQPGGNSCATLVIGDCPAKAIKKLSI